MLMKQRFVTAAILFFLLLTATACAKDKTVYMEMPEISDVTEHLSEEAKEARDILEEPMDERTETQAEEHSCYVYVCGAVKQPGVYVLRAHARIYEAIEAAGGLTEEADFGSVNQAEELSDGQMVKILTKEEASTAAQETEPEADGRIDINKASATELMTLPGIGSAKADSIVSYREQNGGFSSIEEVMQVEGIKEGVFNRMKDRIKVK